MRILLQTVATALALVVTASIAEARQKTPRKPVPLKKGYAAANGVNYYYEIHGEGEPLLLAASDRSTCSSPTFGRSGNIAR